MNTTKSTITVIKGLVILLCKINNGISLNQLSQIKDENSKSTQSITNLIIYSL